MKMLQDKSFEKSLGADLDVDGREYAVMTVTRNGEFVAESQFDKSTGLLAKIRTNAWNPVSGLMAKSESYFSDYKSFGGVMIATEMKEYFDGQIFNEKSIKTFRVIDVVDENLFSIDTK